MKKTKKQIETEKLLSDYLKILETDKSEKDRINKLLKKETKKLASKKETEFAAMFLSAIKF